MPLLWHNHCHLHFINTLQEIHPASPLYSYYYERLYKHNEFPIIKEIKKRMFFIIPLD